MTTANTTIRIKKSTVSGNSPSVLANGEIAINTADGKLFYSMPDGTIEFIKNQSTFSTVNANSSLIIASTPEDILNIIPGENIRITPDVINKTITISAISSGTFTDGTFSGAVIADTLVANTSLAIGGNTSITSTSYITTSTSQVTVDFLPIALYRSAKYEVQITTDSKYHVIELRTLHNGANVWLAQYGEMYSNDSLGLFDATISGDNLNLLFTPTYSSTTVRIYRNAIVI
jgi:hypothetical protein